MVTCFFSSLAYSLIILPGIVSIIAAPFVNLWSWNPWLSYTPRNFTRWNTLPVQSTTVFYLSVGSSVLTLLFFCLVSPFYLQVQPFLTMWDEAGASILQMRQVRFGGDTEFSQIHMALNWQSQNWNWHQQSFLKTFWGSWPPKWPALILAFGNLYPHLVSGLICVTNWVCQPWWYIISEIRF